MSYAYRRLDNSNDLVDPVNRNMVIIIITVNITLKQDNCAIAKMTARCALYK